MGPLGSVFMQVHFSTKRAGSPAQTAGLESCGWPGFGRAGVDGVSCVMQAVGGGREGFFVTRDASFLLGG